jgi:alpha-ketoglutarate-dependent taurine dioxygenase
MKYHLHENGWTVLVEDLDLSKVTEDEVDLLSRLIARYTAVVIRNQKLTLTDELRICHMFKDPKPMLTMDDEYFKQSAADLTADPIGLICRVTGEKDEDGNTGIAGHSEEMSWHNNRTFDPKRKPIIWLYSLRGSAGSRTSYNNTTLAYNDLDQATKDKIKDLKCVYFSGISFSTDALENNEVHKNKQVITEFTPPLVYTNIANQTGLYLSLYQLESFVGMTKEESMAIAEPLFDFITQDKYCYHHDWQDGDVVLAEQWLGVHKRWPFEKIEQRLLHRAAFDFTDQDYTKDIE